MTECAYSSDVYKFAKFLIENVDIKPKIGFIFGTGLGFLAEEIQRQFVIPFKSIPNFPLATTKGHPGNIIFGHIDNIPVMCFQGRFHFFEGYSPQECGMPIRLMKIMGVTHLIVSNSSGALNLKYKVGTIMLIKDHINLVGMAGLNPLRGSNLDDLGPRFPPMTEAYSSQLIKYAHQIAIEEDEDGDVCEGVYGCVSGPNFETVAEVNMLRALGMDSVGMSTVHEVLTAKHCGMTVFAFSVISNVCIRNYDELECPDHEDILTVAKTKERFLRQLIVKMAQYISTF